MESKRSADGKAFSKYHTLGNLCVTERNERILVCCACKCLSTNLKQFWKHQRDEHKIRHYTDVGKGLEQTTDDVRLANAAVKEEKLRSSTRNKMRSIGGVGQQNGSVEGFFDGNEAKYTKYKLPPLEMGVDTTVHDDSPILKRALKNVTKSASNAQLNGQLHEAHNNNNSFSEENFNEFILFCCPECGKRFETNEEWKQHTTETHNYFAAEQLNISLHKVNADGSTVYKCDICNVLLNKPNIAPLRRHKLTHMPYKSFWCRLCGTKIRHKSGIVHHMRVVHHKGREKLYHCAACLKSFYSELQYKKHFKGFPDGRFVCSGFDMTADIGLINTNTKHSYDNGFAVNNNAKLAVCNYDDERNGSIDGDDDHDDVDDDDDIDYDAEEHYDASAFLETEMIEEDFDNITLTANPAAAASAMCSFPDAAARIKKEQIADNTNADNSEQTMLWQEDAAIVAEAKIQTAAAATQRKKDIVAAAAASGAVINPNVAVECPVCGKTMPDRDQLRQHINSHGRNMDCRHCGVKISSLKALRRHLDLKRCKILTGKVSDTNKRATNGSCSHAAKRRLSAAKAMLGRALKKAVAECCNDKTTLLAHKPTRRQLVNAQQQQQQQQQKQQQQQQMQQQQYQQQLQQKQQQQLQRQQQQQRQLQQQQQRQQQHYRPHQQQQSQQQQSQHQQFRCEVCSEAFETKVALCIHGARAHRITDCRLCGVKTSTVGTLRRHYDLNRCKALQ